MYKVLDNRRWYSIPAIRKIFSNRYAQVSYSYGYPFKILEYVNPIRSLRRTLCLSYSVTYTKAVPSVQKPCLAVARFARLHLLGNLDFYGFGVRLDIYLQVFSTVLSLIHPESPAQLYDFQDGNFCSPPGCLYQTDGVNCNTKFFAGAS